MNENNYEKQQYDKLIKEQLRRQGSLPDYAEQYGENVLVGLNAFERNDFLRDKLDMWTAVEIGLEMTSTNSETYYGIFEDVGSKQAFHSLHAEDGTVLSAGYLDFSKTADSQVRVQEMVNKLETLTGDKVVGCEAVDFDDVYCKVRHIDKSNFWHTEYTCSTYNEDTDKTYSNYEARFIKETNYPKPVDNSRTVAEMDTYISQKEAWDKAFKEYISGMSCDKEYKYDINWLAHDYIGTYGKVWKETRMKELNKCETFAINRKTVADMYKELASRNFKGFKTSTTNHFARAQRLQFDALPLIGGNRDFIYGKQTEDMAKTELKLRAISSVEYKQGVHNGNEALKNINFKVEDFKVEGETVPALEAMKAKSQILQDEAVIAAHLNTMYSYVLVFGQAEDKAVAEEMMEIYGQMFAQNRVIERVSPELDYNLPDVKPMSSGWITIPSSMIKHFKGKTENDVINFPKNFKVGNTVLTGGHKDLTGLVPSLYCSDYLYTVWDVSNPEVGRSLPNGDMKYFFQSGKNGKLHIARNAKWQEVDKKTGLPQTKSTYDFEAVDVTLDDLREAMRNFIITRDSALNQNGTKPQTKTPPIPPQTSTANLSPAMQTYQKESAKAAALQEQEQDKAFDIKKQAPRTR